MTTQADAPPVPRPRTHPAIAGDLASGVSTVGWPKQSPSLNDLIDAWKEAGRPRYIPLREEFKRAHKCKITEEFFAQHIHAAAILISEVPVGGTRNADGVARTRLRRPRMPETRTNIILSYDGGIVDARFAEVVRTLCRQQRESSILLAGRSQDILVQDIYTVLLYLLNVLDWVNAPHDGSTGIQPQSLTEQRGERMKAAIESAHDECSAIEQKLRECATKQALSRYLIGLPVGLLLVTLLVLFVAQLRFNIGYLATNSLLAICLATGAVGALVSVMARITRGQQLRVRADLGPGVTILAGGFRPIVGAIFGGVLYILILGGLVPIEIPSVGGKADVNLFFAGIAFLAGFSERWAQDTIVHSTPKKGLDLAEDARSEIPGPSAHSVTQRW